MRIIRGKYGRRRFDVPTSITARPTTDFARENIFNVIENMIDLEGIRALDLFAGTGAISFELLSRGAASVTSVEKAAVQGRFIAAAPGKFDFVFADPPYNMEGFEEIPGRILASGMIAPGGLFIIEHSAKHDFSALPHFHSHRAYGSVNFSLFVIPYAE